MKKIIMIFLTAALLLCLTACSDNSGVSQEEYDKLREELDELRGQITITTSKAETITTEEAAETTGEQRIPSPDPIGGDYPMEDIFIACGRCQGWCIGCDDIPPMENNNSNTNDVVTLNNAVLYEDANICIRGVEVAYPAYDVWGGASNGLQVIVTVENLSPDRIQVNDKGNHFTFNPDHRDLENKALFINGDRLPFWDWWHSSYSHSKIILQSGEIAQFQIECYSNDQIRAVGVNSAHDITSLSITRLYVHNYEQTQQHDYSFRAYLIPRIDIIG